MFHNYQYRLKSYDFVLVRVRIDRFEVNDKWLIVENVERNFSIEGIGRNKLFERILTNPLLEELVFRNWQTPRALLRRVIPRPIKDRLEEPRHLCRSFIRLVSFAFFEERLERIAFIGGPSTLAEPIANVKNLVSTLHEPTAFDGEITLCWILTSEKEILFLE